jgi:leader peptidase (prepilin peptidase)/N-methyltransferase
MDILQFAHDFPVITAIAVFVLGASVGSFLNVVIYRLPIMMYKEWLQQCDELARDPFVQELPTGDISLAKPNSACPSCSEPISPLHNLPLISYLWLKARCPNCGTRISPRYLLVELACAVLALYIYTQYGMTLNTLFVILFSFLLVPLIFIDISHKLLPDDVTYLLLWSGVIYSLSGAGIEIQSSITGIIVGYLSLWSVYIVFKLLTGKEGMGHGDFKLLAAVGAWVGWQQLLTVILISSLAGTVVGIVLMIKARSEQRQMAAIPFGPYLAAGGWITLIWGKDLAHWYLSVIQT